MSLAAADDFLKQMENGQNTHATPPLKTETASLMRERSQGCNPCAHPEVHMQQQTKSVPLTATVTAVGAFSIHAQLLRAHLMTDRAYLFAHCVCVAATLSLGLSGLVIQRCLCVFYAVQTHPAPMILSVHHKDKRF